MRRQFRQFISAVGKLQIVKIDREIEKPRADPDARSVGAPRRYEQRNLHHASRRRPGFPLPYTMAAAKRGGGCSTEFTTKMQERTSHRALKAGPIKISNY
jgi:hypothetical protein